jgi:hypothetical protein
LGLSVDFRSRAMGVCFRTVLRSVLRRRGASAGLASKPFFVSLLYIFRCYFESKHGFRCKATIFSQQRVSNLKQMIPFLKHTDKINNGIDAKSKKPHKNLNFYRFVL